MAVAKKVKHYTRTHANQKLMSSFILKEIVAMLALENSVT